MVHCLVEQAEQPLLPIPLFQHGVHVVQANPRTLLQPVQGLRAQFPHLFQRQVGRGLVPGLRLVADRLQQVRLPAVLRAMQPQGPALLRQGLQGSQDARVAVRAEIGESVPRVGAERQNQLTHSAASPGSESSPLQTNM